MPLQVLVILAAVPTANHLTERYQSSKYREKKRFNTTQKLCIQKTTSYPDCVIPHDTQSGNELGLFHSFEAGVDIKHSRLNTHNKSNFFLQKNQPYQHQNHNQQTQNTQKLTKSRTPSIWNPFPKHTHSDITKHLLSVT